MTVITHACVAVSACRADMADHVPVAVSVRMAELA